MDHISAATGRLHRRLAAVMMLDVAGYSRLSETDVEGTHRRLIAIMDGLVAPIVAAAGGRVVKRTGDGAVIEFSSVSLAVRAAIQIQQAANEAEASRPIEQRIRLRMGVNLGDIIAEDAHHDIYGDGVNIAARLEALGQPGDVILSDAAVQTVDRTGYRFVDLGVQRLKNISRPVRAYRLVISDETDASDASSADEEDDPRLRAGAAAPARRSVRIDHRPTVAVLPFKSGGASAEREEFADDLTENLVNALARWRSVNVVDRNSIFAFKGRDIDLKSIAQQLGARYALEGSLRWAGGRVRVNIQFVDIDTMDHLLAEQFEQEVADSFVARDGLILDIAGALEPQFLRHERDRAGNEPDGGSTPYEWVQHGLWRHFRFTPADNAVAQAFFRRALEFDRSYAQAAAALAICQTHAVSSRWTPGTKEAFSEAVEHARNAVSSDPRDPLAHFAVGVVYMNRGLYQDAIGEFNEAVRLNPSHIPSLANLGLTYNCLDKPNLALPVIELAVRLSSHDPRLFVWLPILALTHYLAGRYRDCLVVCQRALAAKPEYPVALRYLVAVLGQLGRKAEAQPILPMLRRFDGDLAGTEAHFRRMLGDSAAVRLLDGVRLAGFE